MKPAVKYRYNWLILWSAYVVSAVFGELWLRESGIGYVHVFPNGDILPWDWFVFFRYDDLNPIIILTVVLLSIRSWSWRHYTVTIQYILFRCLVYWDFYQSNNHDHTAFIYGTVIAFDILTCIIIIVSDRIIFKAAKAVIL